MHDNETILLAKQPIYQKDNQLYGFELLFRDDFYTHALEIGEDAATSQVLVNYATSISDEIDRQGRPVFINVSESFLLSEAFLPIDKNCVVIEILERVNITNEFISAVKSWHSRGYRFALDDYDFDKKWAPLLPFIAYIKVDVLDIPLESIETNLVDFDRSPFKLIAERVEDQKTFDRCIELGFDLIQGYYLARPKELLGNTIRPSSVITSKIINKANDDNCDISELAELVSMDPKLTLQLLKLINSSLFSLPREIRDLKEALGFLGIDLLKQWALMIAFVADAEAHIESSRIILIRAKACELYYALEETDEDLAAAAFLAALLSGVDLLLEIEPQVFIDSLNLSKELQDAILRNDGPLGQLIEKITNIEYFITQDPNKVVSIDVDMLSYYSQAQRWAGDVIDTLSS